MNIWLVILVSLMLVVAGGILWLRKESGEKNPSFIRLLAGSLVLTAFLLCLPFLLFLVLAGCFTQAHEEDVWQQNP